MQGRKIWIGRWLIVAALLHTIVGFIMGGPTLMAMLRGGPFNSVHGQPITGVVIWFLMFGAPLAGLGMAINELEHSAQFASARALGIGAALVIMVGIFLMPISGFWLAVPPAIALLCRGPGAYRKPS